MELITVLRKLKSHDQALYTCLAAQPHHAATLGQKHKSPQIWNNPHDLNVVDVDKGGQSLTVEAMALRLELTDLLKTPQEQAVHSMLTAAGGWESRKELSS